MWTGRNKYETMFLQQIKSIHRKKCGQVGTNMTNMLLETWKIHSQKKFSTFSQSNHRRGKNGETALTIGALQVAGPFSKVWSNFQKISRCFFYSKGGNPIIQGFQKISPSCVSAIKVTIQWCREAMSASHFCWELGRTSPQSMTRVINSYSIHLGIFAIFRNFTNLYKMTVAVQSWLFWSISKCIFSILKASLPLVWQLTMQGWKIS